MKIVVLGGSGFLGSHLCDLLSSRGHDVNIFDVKKSKSRSYSDNNRFSMGINQNGQVEARISF